MFELPIDYLSAFGSRIVTSLDETRSDPELKLRQVRALQRQMNFGEVYNNFGLCRSYMTE